MFDGNAWLRILAALLLALLAPLPAAADGDSDDGDSDSGGGVKTVTVSCADGDRIADALATEAHRLTVEIRGICEEDVVVARDRVTLRGGDPAIDGIRAAETDAAGEPFASTLLIDGAHQVTVENLQLTGAVRAGLWVHQSRELIDVVNCRLTGNGVVGAFLTDAFATFTDSLMAGNGLLGLFALRNSGASCTRCTIEDNGSDVAVLLQRASNVSMLDSEIRDGRVSCNNASQVVLDNTSIASPVHAIGAGRQCVVTMSGGTLDGSVRALSKTEVQLLGVQQLSVEVGGVNAATNDSYIRSAGSDLLGLFVTNMSRGLVQGGGSVGNVACGNGGDVFCDGSETKTGSSCAQCP